jgi:hypothetical protein
MRSLLGDSRSDLQEPDWVSILVLRPITRAMRILCSTYQLALFLLSATVDLTISSRPHNTGHRMWQQLLPGEHLLVSSDLMAHLLLTMSMCLLLRIVNNLLGPLIFPMLLKNLWIYLNLLLPLLLLQLTALPAQAQHRLLREVLPLRELARWLASVLMGAPGRCLRQWQIWCLSMISTAVQTCTTWLI